MAPPFLIKSFLKTPERGLKANLNNVLIKYDIVISKYPLSEVNRIKVLLAIPWFETDFKICPIDSSISAKASPNGDRFVWKDHFSPESYGGIT